MATATKTKLKNFIGGEAVDPAEGGSEDVVNPATGEAIAEAPLSTKADVDAAVAAAKGAFDGWAATPPGERARALLRIADLIEERGEEIADLEAADAGKPRSAVLEDEVPVMADNLRFFAGAARCLEGRAAGEYMEGHTSFIRREPVGVVGQITPWNYPLMMAIWKIGPALGAGNTVVLKPAETTPLTTLLFAEWCADILPPGVLNVIGGHGEPAGAELVTHPDVEMVSLTGSPPTGKWIAKAAADTLKRVHLELGGKAPVVVFDDVDMETALETIAGTGYYNAGQDCTAATRVLAAEGRLRRRRQRARRRGEGPRPRRHALRRHDPRAAQLRSASASGSRASSSASPATPRSSPAAPSPTCPATSSSRPSSPGSSRTTR